MKINNKLTHINTSQKNKNYRTIRSKLKILQYAENHGKYNVNRSLNGGKIKSCTFIYKKFWIEKVKNS